MSEVIYASTVSSGEPKLDLAEMVAAIERFGRERPPIVLGSIDGFSIRLNFANRMIEFCGDDDSVRLCVSVYDPLITDTRLQRAALRWL